ncbi:MAG: type II 3-dehydroquinate dehydratase [Pseudomonadota bacterium]
MSAAHSVLILTGPNLNLLGQREPSIYGTATLADIEAGCHERATRYGLSMTFKQSNHEGELVEMIQQAINTHDAIIINGGAYTHTSVAIHDALRMVGVPILEVHLSNPHQREEFRHQSFITPVATGLICGLGQDSYLLAIDAVASLLNKEV